LNNIWKERREFLFWQMGNEKRRMALTALLIIVLIFKRFAHFKAVFLKAINASFISKQTAQF